MRFVDAGAEESELESESEDEDADSCMECAEDGASKDCELSVELRREEASSSESLWNCELGDCGVSHKLGSWAEGESACTVLSVVGAGVGLGGAVGTGPEGAGGWGSAWEVSTSESGVVVGLTGGSVGIDFLQRSSCFRLCLEDDGSSCTNVCSILSNLRSCFASLAA
jgi:hypothetical protein